MTLPKIIETNIREHRLIEPGDRVLAAASGGVDSMVLLRVLAELREKGGWELAVGHFNHQLRGAASDADEDFVRRLASEIGLPFYSGRGDVHGQAKESGESIEMAARELRHRFFARTAEEIGAWKCALGHHADDQVELFLLRVLRGSAGEGLTGMKWKGASPVSGRLTLVRPMLNVSRREIEEFAGKAGIRFQHDESNDEIHFERNKLRHKLIPFLRENFQQHLERNILRLMEVLSGEKEFVRREAEKAKGSGVVFEELPVALQRQVLFSDLVAAGIRPEFELIEALRKTPETPVMVRPGLSVARGRDGALVQKGVTKLEFSEETMQLNVCRAGEVSFSGLSLAWKLVSPAPVPGGREEVELFDAAKVGSMATLRHWQPGDRFQPIGLGQDVKLQNLLMNAQIPAEKRRKLVVAISETGEIFWVEGLRIGEGCKITGGTQTALEWRWNRGGPLAE